MANRKEPTLPSPSPEHRRVATAQFERANQVVATGNYDYGIRLLLSCCKLDPANLIYRQALRRTEKAKFQNNMRGSVFAWLTSGPAKARLKAALAARDYLKAIEHGESILTRNPWDVGTQMSLAAAADALGLLDLAIWYLEQARQKVALDPHLNRTLANYYERRGNFTQAIALWELVRKVRPADKEAQHKVKDLAADDTIARGQYEAVLGQQPEEGPADGTDNEAAPLAQQETRPAPALPARRGSPEPAGPADRVSREAAPLRARLEKDPTNVNLYLQLAGVYRRAGDVGQALAAAREGLGPTGNAWELAVEVADLETEPFRRDLAVTEEKLKAKPEAEELRELRARLRKEVYTRELDIYRQKSDRYPTEMAHHYEVGLRLLRLGQVDEAIRELQMARSDPRFRWQSLLQLGHCFKDRNNWRLAQRNFEEALKALPVGEIEHRKEALYELASGCASSGDLSHALDLAHELANLDYNYRDISRLLEEWQAAASSR
jgi:tetratricopeptide (TPR) repeat protein